MEAFCATSEAPAQHQQAVLRRLLHVHAGIDLLARHGAAVPPAVAPPPPGAAEDPAAAAAAGAAALELLRKLPLTTYSDYEPLVEEVVAAGRAFTPADPAAQARWDAACARLSGAQPTYALWCSSGTTGSQKRLPASQLALQSNMKARWQGGALAALRCECMMWCCRRRAA